MKYHVIYVPHPAGLCYRVQNELGMIAGWPSSPATAPPTPRLWRNPGLAQKFVDGGCNPLPDHPVVWFKPEPGSRASDTGRRRDDNGFYTAGTVTGRLRVKDALHMLMTNPWPVLPPLIESNEEASTLPPTNLY